MRGHSILLLLVAAAGTLFPTPTGATAACTEVDVPVALAAGGAPSDTVYGLLCQQSPARDPIQILVSGATEAGPAYWDFPALDYYGADPTTYLPLRARYSYVKYLIDAGYDSLTIDRIGTGKSSHPPAHEVTVPSNAYVIHQVVQALRSGAVGGHAYTKVIGVGHSLGAAPLYEVSVDYGGLDGLLIQSFRQHRQPSFALVPLTFMPAQLEPRFADTPPGYITTRPGTRGDTLFYRANAEEQVIAHEELTKETLTDGEVATLPASFEYTKLVGVPVISIVGEYDSFFCSPGCPEAAQEGGFFPNVACFESHVVPDSGHDANLQMNGRTEVFPLMLDWVEGNFGPGQSPCGP